MFDKTRIISGVIMIFALFLVALIDDKILTFTIFAAMIFFALKESEALFKETKISIVCVFIAFVIGTLSEKVLLSGILLNILVLGYLVFKKSETLRPLLPYIYPTLPIFALWQVYLDSGMFALFWLVFIVASCDTCAYFIGKLFGSTSFSPTSPNKTREGVIGGVLCATFLGTFIGLFGYSFFLSLFCSFFVAIFAVIGDLIESYFKRVAGLKDSGDLIPGHGGILDRIDAVIIASFVMVLFV